MKKKPKYEIPPTAEILSRLSEISREANVLRQLLRIARKRDLMNGTRTTIKDENT